MGSNMGINIIMGNQVNTVSMDGGISTMNNIDMVT